MRYKKLTICVVALCASLGAFAGEPQRLAVEEGAHHPLLSPDGSVLLYSSVDHTGLKALDMTTGEVIVIDEDASAGFAPVFSQDGSTVYYRTATMVDGLLYRDVRSYDFRTAATAQLQQPSRKSVNLYRQGNATYAYAEYKYIIVSLNGEETQISPLPEAHSYLWASLSPQGDRLAFDEPFSGVYVAKSDGSEAQKVLPKGDFVSWAGEQTLIAVVSHDDGYVILDSTIVAIDIASGEVTALTDENMLVSEATACPSGLVVFSDINGNMYTLQLDK